ncbi:hypothetical protein DM826_00390 [Halonotius aquaticus]|uniref:Uncharacterized protein n=1 Tax=Halonotius aquaticus TaxID=2216978 RepID=A0A3A6QER7_9EURY|nr:hypothetical protein [Halonotius aquaticus]RJX45190.1 hypothetical protein DM826_00390 [Halonotius aquaticus]
MPTDNKPTDTENKAPWLRFGEQREATFLDSVAPALGLAARENPAKADDPTALDLLVEGEPADLKTQETPFFTAERKYGLPPQHVVTFNANDYERYKQKGDPDIFFWVRWREELSGWGAEVEEMEGVWRTSVAQIEALVEAGQAPLHRYQRRQGDQENANASYLLDLRAMDCLDCFTEPCA